MALGCVYVHSLKPVCMCGSGYKSNAVHAGRQCVCPHPNQEQVKVKVSVFILLKGFFPVFLSDSLFLSFSQ